MDEPEILYSDNHLLALSKPAGWLTQDSGQESAQNVLELWGREIVRQEKQKEGNVFLHAVHRLDRLVSGVVLLARTSKALGRLQEAQRQRDWGKRYVAVVESLPSPSEGSLHHFLRHDDRRATVVSSGTPNAKKAWLDYRWLATEGSLHLLEILLHTGRYHQIRAQLSAIGCIIVGDRLYGSRLDAWKSDTIALHHCELSLLHPVSRQALCIKAPIPEHWPEFSSQALRPEATT